MIVPVLKMSSISDALVASRDELQRFSSCSDRSHIIKKALLIPDFFAATLAGAGFAGVDLVMTDLSVFLGGILCVIST